jgi:hypothetical protein
MEPFKRVFRQLLAPKELADLSMRDQKIRYVHNGETREFDTLSSGEREVVTVAFDLLLRSPEDCIVVFDEPELHLHPELSHKLVYALQSIGHRNQFILTTHSPDIITSSLDRSVVFLAPAATDVDPAQSARNQAVPVAEDDETHEALKLLGQSIGIVALGRRIVLIEGSHASVDKQVYGSILKQQYPDLVLVPSGGRHAIESFAHVPDAVLSKSLWGVEFFMLCDGDSRPVDAAADDRLAVLSRYHLENYFLDETVWEAVFEGLELDSTRALKASAIRERLRALAREQMSLAVALKVAAGVRLRAGNVDVMPKGCHGLDEVSLIELLKQRVSAEDERLQGVVNASAVENQARAEFARLAAAIEADTDTWKAEIPGKQLLARFASEVKLAPGHAKGLYVRAADKIGSKAFDEIVSIFGRFAGHSG